MVEVIDIVSSQPLTDRLDLDLDLDIDSDSDLDLGIDKPYKSSKAQEIESSPRPSLDHRLSTPVETISSESTLSHL